jgi:hypothetical protein
VTGAVWLTLQDASDHVKVSVDLIRAAVKAATCPHTRSVKGATFGSRSLTSMSG